MELFNGQTQTLLPGQRLIKVKGYTGAEKYSNSMPRDCEASMFDEDEDYCYIAKTDTNGCAQSINQLGYQMDQCCCSIKTQMLQDRLTDKTAEAVALQNKLDNRDQTQTILGSLGRFVAWAGSGSQAAAGAA